MRIRTASVVDAEEITDVHIASMRAAYSGLIAAEELARIDVLTRLLNRRAFEAAIEAECARARRTGAPLTLVYLDVDHFKGINDRFGHASGDQVLRQVALAIRETIRGQVDGGFRLGGDEFALLLPASTQAQAEKIF